MRSNRSVVLVFAAALLAGLPPALVAAADEPPGTAPASGAMEAAPAQHGSLEEAARAASLVAIATIMEVERSPECWAGPRRCKQEVELRLDTVWRGPIKPEIKLEVDFPLVQGSKSADPAGPWLNATLFGVGQQHIVLLKERPDKDETEKVSKGELEDVYEAVDADYGVVPLTESGRVRAALGLGT